MTQKNNVTHPLLSPARPMVAGAAIGFLLISLFVFGVNHPHPEWGSFWRVRPLLVVPAAGAMGGLVFAFLRYLSTRGRINKTLAFVLGFLVFLISLWLGTVLGLAGTLWH